MRCKNNAIDGSEFCHVHTNCAESVVKSETRRKVHKKKTFTPKDKSAKKPKDAKSKVKKEAKSKTKKEVEEKSHEDKPKKKDAKSKVKKDEKSKPKEEKEMPRIIIAQKQRAKPYPVVEGFKVYPIHSRGKGEWKKMSPFFIGPVEFIDSEGNVEESPIFENYWQGHKVWKKVDKQKQKASWWEWPAEVHVGKDGEPNDAWYEWHYALLKYDKAVRRPNGRKVPEYAWWFDQKTKKHEKLGLVESRKKIYIDHLKKLYRESPVYKKLLKDFRNGQNVLLIEPDGPWRELYPDGKEVTLDLLKKWISKTNYKEEGHEEKYFPYGHGYVAAMCLFEDF